MIILENSRQNRTRQRRIWIGTTYLIAKILAKKIIKIVFRPHKTLKQLFQSTKDTLDPMQGLGIYKISCSYGKAYIGQTGRPFKAHLKEHIADTNHN